VRRVAPVTPPPFRTPLLHCLPEAGGKPATLGPGDVAVFPRGWRGPWELHETVRKVYVVF